MPYTVLAADADTDRLARAARLLRGAGYTVITTRGFAEARRQLTAARPDVLVTSVRLGGVNGVDLAAIGRASLPDLVCIVTHAGFEPALHAAADRQAAIYLAAELDSQICLSVIAQELAARPPRAWRGRQRRWPRKRLTMRVDVALCGAAGVLADLSYGGAQLQLQAPPADAAAGAIYLAAESIEVRIRRVWARAAGRCGPWWCGVEVDSMGPAPSDAWRAFVDGAA